MRTTLTLLALGLAAAAAPAQLNLKLKLKFVDTQAGGNGNIGVTQDERTFNYYVIDFSNTMTVHEFDIAGTFLSQFGTSQCTPGAPSPNDITYDPTTDRLWMVDNTPTVVIEMDRTGQCQSGWSFTQPSANPVGITYNRITNTLWMSSDGQVSEWSKTGTRLAGGFAFRPASGSTILSGIAHSLVTDRYYVTQSSGRSIFELDKNGTLLSTTDLSSFGVVNTQGIHYSLLLNQFVVADNTQSTIYVFDVGSTCAGQVTARGSGCRDPQGTPLTLGYAGCPDLGKQLTLQLRTSAANMAPAFFAMGTSDTVGFGGPLPLSLTPFGAPGCSVYTSTNLVLGPLPNPGGGSSLQLNVPNDITLIGLSLYWQALQAGPPITTPLPIVTSDYLQTTFG